MFRGLAKLFFFCAILLCNLPSGYAGPACTKKYYKTAQCVQKCGARWGYPGSMMGRNPWGVVMAPSEGDPKKAMAAAIAEACGTATTSTKEVEVDEDQEDTKISGAVGGGPADDTNDDTTSIVEAPVSTTITKAALIPTSSSIKIATSSKSSSSVARFVAEESDTPVPQKTTSTRKPAPTPAPTPAPKPEEPKEEEPAPAPAPAQGGDIGEYLRGHNDFRAKHGAAPLTWNDNLARQAQIWANKCVFEHSGGSLGPFGENLAAGTGSAYGIANAIKSWTDELKDYNPNAPQASHFTQVVWKNSKRVGCALALCDGIFEARFGKAKYVVCEYDPPGNFNNDFARNVQV